MSEATVPILEGKHTRPIGFDRNEPERPQIEIVKVVPVDLLKKAREAFEELRRPLK